MDISEAITDLINLEIRNKRRVWKPFMEKYDCQTICEIGVQLGENFNLMIQHNPQIAVAVDSWINDGTASRNDGAHPQEILDRQYQKFADRMADRSFVHIFREYSFDAAKRFPDNYFDLIYIDADHSYEGCLKDIESWYPKVKKGKFLTGDDYRNGFVHRTGVVFGVIEAVNRFTKKNNLKVYELPQYGWVIIK